MSGASNICVIPARGGSKRIPRKNIAPFCGRPMMSWSLGAALSSGVFDRIVVSTDDAEIADIARAEGAEVPFLRPPELSDDTTTTISVIRHAIETLYENKVRPDFVCCLYATAPFLRADDLRAAKDLSASADFVIPVGRFPAPVQRALATDADGNLRMLSPENYTTRSQDLQETFFDAGQFYWARTEAWINGVSPFDQRVAPLLLPRGRVQDIDTPEDWAFAELLFRAQGLDQADASRGDL
jgi:N-acylneuraminate cytidylyltransferase